MQKTITFTEKDLVEHLTKWAKDKGEFSSEVSVTVTIKDAALVGGSKLEVKLSGEFGATPVKDPLDDLRSKIKELARQPTPVPYFPQTPVFGAGGSTFGDISND